MLPLIRHGVPGRGVRDAAVVVELPGKEVAVDGVLLGSDSTRVTVPLGLERLTPAITFRKGGRLPECTGTELPK